MKKRILSIFITICMAVAIMPMMPTASASAEELERWEDCTCLIHCTDDNMKADCPRCSKEGAKAVDCAGRNLWGTFFDTTGLQNAMNLSATYPTLYYQVDDDEFEGYNGVVKLNKTITVPENANALIDLNGCTISGNGVSRIFDVYGKLTIIDTKGGGKLTMGTYGAITIKDGGYVLMQGGAIEENSNGGVFVETGGTFEMTGGTLVKNVVMPFTSSTLVVTNLIVYGGGTFIIDGDAENLTDRQGKQYGGQTMQFWDMDSKGIQGIKSTVYADGGVMDGAILNQGIITSTHAGEWAIFKGNMWNEGIISAGKYTGGVTNTEQGTISDGSFECKVTNDGLVNGGTFDAAVDNNAQGTISGGTFSENSVVKNTGTISGGTFLGTVESENGTIEDSAKVSVHFVDVAGENIKTVKVLRGQKMTLADLPEIDPTQYGYNVVKYTVGKTEYRDNETFVNGVRFIEDETYVNVELVYPKTYTITCDLNGGTGRETYNYTVNFPDFTLENPTKEGYTFFGWRLNSDSTIYNPTLTVTIPQGSIGDRAYTAVYMKDWSTEVYPPNGYSIVFDTQGGSPVESKTGLSTADKVLDGVTEPTKAGYKFMWWECGGSPVALADTTVAKLVGKADKGVITLTARWQEKRTVSFDKTAQEYTCDGTGKAFEIKDTNIANPDGFNVTYLQNGNTVAAPTDVGSYDVIITRAEDDIFKAVNETIKDGLVIKQQEVTATIGDIPDQTYTGKAIEPAITVSDGTNEIPSSEYTVDYTKNIYAGTATVTVTDKVGGNYTFAQLSKNFTINKKSITPAVTMADYVYGTMPDYPVVSGNEGIGEVSIYYSTHDDLATNADHRQLWDVANIDGTTLDAGTYYMLVEVAETQNYKAGSGQVITFKVTPAKPEAPAAPILNGSTVTINEADRSKALEYSLNGGDWITVPQLDANGSFALSDLDNNGYTIALRQQGSTDGNYAASDAVSCFSVACNANGGTINSGDVKYYTYGVGATLPTDVARAGYRFAGWYDNEACTGDPVTAISDTATGAKEYWAKWTLISSGGGDSYTPSYKPTVEQPKNGAVSTSTNNPTAGTKVTITPKPDEGYKLYKITVTDQNGNPVEVIDNGDGTYRYIQPVGKVTIKVIFVEANDEQGGFVDVFPEDYYYDAVQWAIRNGITEGVDDTSFAPNADCTRAQAVTFLWRAAGSPAPKSSEMPFTDVAAGSYYYDAVLWAVENGITKGTSDTTFTPNAKCTRAQIVTFLYRCIK